MSIYLENLLKSGNQSAVCTEILLEEISVPRKSPHDAVLISGFLNGIV